MDFEIPRLNKAKSGKTYYNKRPMTRKVVHPYSDIMSQMLVIELYSLQSRNLIQLRK